MFPVVPLTVTVCERVPDVTVTVPPEFGIPYPSKITDDCPPKLAANCDRMYGLLLSETTVLATVLLFMSATLVSVYCRAAVLNVTVRWTPRLQASARARPRSAATFRAARLTL